MLLLDASHLQDEDPARANRYRYSKHRPALPLYTVADAEAVLEQLESRVYEHPSAVVDGMEARLRRAGHEPSPWICPAIKPPANPICCADEVQCPTSGICTDSTG